jgi:hypothetical protein
MGRSESAGGWFWLQYIDDTRLTKRMPPEGSMVAQTFCGSKPPKKCYD